LSASAMESKVCSDHFDLAFLVRLEAFRLAIALYRPQKLIDTQPSQANRVLLAVFKVTT
jgi:hypothetical protein